MSFFRHLSRASEIVWGDFTQCVLLVFIPLMIAQALYQGISRFLPSPWSSIAGFIFFFMPAFVVIGYAVVNIMEVEIGIGDLMTALKDFSISAMILGALLIPVVWAGLMMVNFIPIPLLTRAAQGILPLLPLFFTLFLVDKDEGVLKALGDGLYAFFTGILFFIFYLGASGVLMIGASVIAIPGRLPLVGLIFWILSMLAVAFVQTLMVFTLGSFYWEISGKEREEEARMKRREYDIKEMPSVWKKPEKVKRPANVDETETSSEFPDAG